MKPQQNPKELIDRAKNGDIDAFGTLYELYFVPIFRYIFLRIKNKEDAEDLTQTVFLKVYSSISRFKEQGKSPLAYFFTVARNVVIDHWRKKKEVILTNSLKIVEKISERADKNQYQAMERKEMASIINQILDQLTEEQKEVIVLKFMEGFSNQEIAEIMAKSEEAIRQLQCRALKAIRQYFKDIP